MSNTAVTLSYTQLIILAVAPALIGGLTGLTGAFLGPWWLEERKQAAERKKRRAEKFEELVTTLFELHHWMTVMRNVRVFEEDTELAMSPMARVQAITSVYFPEFEDDIKALDHSVDAYELWAMEARGRRLKKEPDFADGGSEAYEPYLENFHSLMRKLRGYARKEFQ